jgi:hypothetical protein
VLPAFYRKVRQLEAQFRTFYFYGKRQAAFWASATGISTYLGFAEWFSYFIIITYI